MSFVGSLLPASGFVVAYSGGVDSHVLLHILARSREESVLPPMRALHVHHGLSPNADVWGRHCARVCAALGVPLAILTVDARPAAGESPEAAARRARYAALREALGEGEVLLTAHTATDQAETLLLQLLRGAGPAGVAAMPRVRDFGRGRHARPLLDISRGEVECHARAAHLQWVDDESNDDPRFDRNYLRAEIMPRLAVRWSAIETTLGRAARFQAEAARLLSDLAELDRTQSSGSRRGTLSVRALLSLPDHRRRNLLRHWIGRLGLPLPDAGRLACIEREVLAARADAMPCLRWPGAVLRRYRDDLYALPPPPPHDPAAEIAWPSVTPLDLPGRRVTADDLRACGVEIMPGENLTVRYRRGGERLRLHGQTHALKKLMQEWGIPPWERDRVPLVYRGDELLCAIRPAV